MIKSATKIVCAAISIELLALSVTFGQQADVCDRALIANNISVIQQNDFVRLHMSEFLIRNRMEKESHDLFAAYGGGVLDYDDFKEKTEAFSSQNSLTYSHERALSVFLYHLPQDAHKTWLRCKELNSETSLFQVSVGKSAEGRVNLFFLWRPSDVIPGRTLQIVGSTVKGLEMPEELRPGTRGFTLNHGSLRGILGTVTGSVGTKDFAVEIFVPQRTKVISEYYIGPGDILSCSQRGGHPCWLKSQKAISADPPDAGLSHVTFRVPRGSLAFRATVAPPQCGAAQAVLYVEQNGRRVYQSSWPGNTPIDIPLDSSGGDLQIGADAIGSAACDTIWFQNPRFVRSMAVE